jgi:hypothetical protein
MTVDYFYSSAFGFPQTRTKPLILCETGNTACFLLSICRGIVKVHTTPIINGCQLATSTGRIAERWACVGCRPASPDGIKPDFS